MDAKAGDTKQGSSFSKTAVYAAACRARATLMAQPLCSDPWASALAGDEGEPLIEEVLVLCPDMHPAEDVLVSVRAGYFDAQVKRHLQVDGFKQVVILGAGLDTRAARLAHPGVVFYEVDRAETQQEKLRRVKALAGYPVGAAIYVSCDIEREDPLAALATQGFKLDEPALFVLEGLIHYLTDRAVRTVLGSIAKRCNPRSTVLFDYLNDISDDVVPALDLGIQDGEPLRWMTKDPMPMLARLGFRHVRTKPFDQLYLSMTGEACAEYGFIKCVHLAHATSATEASPYLW